MATKKTQRVAILVIMIVLVVGTLGSFAVMILAHIAIKSFDLVAAMTAGGPGYSSDLPAMFMYSFTFSRGQMGVGSASAILMLGAILAIIVPYLYSELRAKRND